jgi:acetyl esterase/lipase
MSRQETIRLYPGKAPGSENWEYSETEVQGHIGGNVTTVVINVADPTLTAFIPEQANGTAIIIVPGGAFHMISFEDEGTLMAEKFLSKGITVFILKYRLVQQDPHNMANTLGPLLSGGNFDKLKAVSAPILPLMVQDGQTAVKYVREHAAAYSLDPQKIGLMGFSAGGAVAMSVVYQASDENRPNFMAPIYAAPWWIGSDVPTVQTPIFIMVASDDSYNFAPDSAKLYLKWLQAKQPAELHIYEKGGHGFGGRKQNLPVDTWIDRFVEWLTFHGYLN